MRVVSPRTWMLMMICTSLVGIQVVAQTQELQFAKAKKLYEHHDYREALYEFNIYINDGGVLLDAFYYRGSCYMSVNQVDLGMSDFYYVLKIDPQYSMALYRLAKLYEQRENYDQALNFYEQYSLQQPKEAESYVRQAIVYAKAGGGDDDYTVDMMEKAYRLDNENEQAIYYLAWARYLNQSYDEAIVLANKGKQYDPMNVEWYKILGNSEIHLGNYETAANLMRSVIQKLPFDNQLFTIYADALNLQHTPNTLLREEENGHYLTFVEQASLKELDMYSREGQLYAYNILYDSYGMDDLLGLDKYFMLYYGFSNQEHYDPYSMKESRCDVLFEEGQYKACLEEADRKLQENPAHLESLLYAIVSTYQLQDMEQYGMYIRHYYGYMNGILASGDGDSFEHAIIVINPQDEHTILSFLGYEFIRQSLVVHQSHSYDLVTVLDDQGEEKELYFNIDKPFGALSSLMTSDAK